MKIREIIEFLRDKDQEEELYVEWWTKSEFADEGLPFFDDVTWERAVQLAVDADLSYIHTITRDMLIAAIYDAIEEESL